MEGPDRNDDATRRTLLRVLAAAGFTGGGIAATSGSTAAHGSDHKKKGGKEKGQHHEEGHKKGHGKGHGKFEKGYRRYKCELKREGKIVKERDGVDHCEVGDTVTYAGTLLVTAVRLSDTNEVLVSGELRGTLEGDASEEIAETFEDVSLGTLQEIFTVRSADDPEDCPIVQINIGGLCLELLGLQIRLETIEIDPVGIIGEDNVVSDLLCDLLRRFSY